MNFTTKFEVKYLVTVFLETGRLSAPPRLVAPLLLRLRGGADFANCEGVSQVGAPLPKNKDLRTAYFYARSLKTLGPFLVQWDKN